VHSAERLVLSLLRQVCDLGPELASDDLSTYPSEFGPSRASESAEMKPQDGERVAVEGSQETAGGDGGDGGASPGDPPKSEPTEGATGLGFLADRGKKVVCADNYFFKRKVRSRFCKRLYLPVIIFSFR
jgi:hypothetical protein